MVEIEVCRLYVEIIGPLVLDATVKKQINLRTKYEVSTVFIQHLVHLVEIVGKWFVFCKF
ncbi:MAG: hypothetical protein B7Y07_03685 [Halothiobacillus sp. 24-54-40]|nr:MAG: hypothetical protein B7Y07_03685 [Halothiobacillus sp. 24-54-40]